MHDLDQHTPLYLDCYVALRVLGMLYSEYIQRTTPLERLMNQLFIGLSSAKDTHEQWHSDLDHEEIEAATEAIGPRGSWH